MDCNWFEESELVVKISCLIGLQHISMLSCAVDLPS
jgi:hypothetical protein